MLDRAYYSTVLCNITWCIPERYQQLEPIGYGTFGSVCRALDTKTGQQVAIKKLLHPVSNSFRAHHTHREVKILREVSHDNVIDLLDLFSCDGGPDTLRDIYLVSTLMGSDLFRILQTQTLSMEHIRFMIYQILRGLKYIHSAGIIHRDLKPNNIGINENCELRILDFGMARPVDKNMSAYVAMRWYRAPEIMYNWTTYDQTADVWSVGCMMAEMLINRPLFPGRDQIEQFWRIAMLLGTPGAGLVNKMQSSSARAYIRSFPEMKPKDFSEEFADASPQARDLLELMLVWDPEDRVTAEKALKHSFFEAYHDPKDEPTHHERVLLDFEHTQLTLQEWKTELWHEIEEFKQSRNCETTEN